MQVALEEHNHAVVKSLLHKDKRKKLLHETYNGQTALHIACASGDIELVQILLKFKPAINEKDENQQTCLHIACRLGYISVVTLLLQHNPNVTSTDAQGNTPLHLLSVHHPTSENVSAFYKILEQMQMSGMNLQERNELGDTPLHCATLANSEKFALWLIRQGSDVTTTNLKGETPLHYAARTGSLHFNSVLIGVGAIPNQQAEEGTARDYAEIAGRMEIVSLYDEVYSPSLSQSETIIINKTQVALESMLHYQNILSSLVATPAPKTNSVRRRLSHSLVRSGSKQGSHAKKMARYTLMASLLEINYLLLNKQPLDDEKWWGIIRFPEDSKLKNWVSKFCSIDSEQINLYNGSIGEPTKLIGTIPLTDVSSFRVYTNFPSRFSILYHGDDVLHSIEHFGAKEEQVLEIVETLVLATGKAVDYIDNFPLLSLLQRLSKPTNIIDKVARRTSNNKHRRSMSANVSKAMVAALAQRTAEHRVTSSRLVTKTKKEAITKPIVQENGRILCDTNFCSFMFQEVFSSDLRMERAHESDQHFIFYSGSLGDILNYLLLHSGHRAFDASRDAQAFYMSYYRFFETEEVLSAIESIWDSHMNHFWPSPYCEVSPDIRLFHFLHRFIESPFVLSDKEKEVTFRGELAALYGMLVPSPTEGDKTYAQLRSIVQRMKKSRMQAFVSQSCDLNSLLCSTPRSPKFMFDINQLDIESIVAQIICINADLYKQLQISEFLDLRFQKDKSLSLSLNKVHDFSNKIYHLVPTSILASDDPEIQKETLKRWIVIAEKIFQLRDYNSSIQIINGVMETSIMRLKHLQGCLSVKWIDRVNKIRNSFDAEGSYAAYRKLPMNPPSIPFIGVALKDLVFTYEANPDLVDGNVNFQKMRIVCEVIRSLQIEQPRQIDYSHLKFDPEISQALLNIVPLDQDQLYERSDAIRKIIVDTEEMKELTGGSPRKQLIQMKQEMARLQADNKEKDEIIASLMQQLKQKNIALDSIKVPKQSPKGLETFSQETSEQETESLSPIGSRMPEFLGYCA